MKITFFFLMLLGNGLLSCWHGLFKRVAKLVSVPRRFTSEFRSVPRGVSRKFGSTRGFKLRGSSGLPRVPQVLKVVYHLPQIPGNFGWDVNGKRFLGASQWKIPGTNGNSEKVVPFSRLGRSEWKFVYHLQVS